MTGKASKFRYEMKYICSIGQGAILKSRVASYLQLDAFAGQRGYYNIRSLYFDDYDDQAYWEKEDGVDPREKYRIRIYNSSLERISLELKKKHCGKIQKESCRLTKEQYELLCAGEKIMPAEENNPLLNRFGLQQMTMGMSPRVIVEYDRVPYVYASGNVRITFDENIASISSHFKMEQEDAPKRMILPMGQMLLEVKFDEFLPDYIYRMLQLENLHQTAFSKYYLCRKYAV